MATTTNTSTSSLSSAQQELLRELGRAQTAWTEYGQAGRTDLQQNAAQYGQQLRQQASSLGLDLNQYGTQTTNGRLYTQYYQPAGGPAGKYDVTQQGLVTRPETPTPKPSTPPATTPSVAAPANRFAQQTLSTVQAQQPKTIATPNPTMTPGSTVNTTALRQAIGQAPQQVFNMNQLTRLMQQQQQAGTNLGPRQFTLEELSRAIQQANTAGQNPNVPNARFADPQQMTASVNQMLQVMNPLIQTQQQEATASYNQAAQRLMDQWAARGLGASGAAAANQIDAANQLARDVSQIQAAGQAEAMNRAFQFQELGLQEDAQRFSQQANIRDFVQARAQQYVQNIAGGMSQEEAMRQFQQEFAQAKSGQSFNQMLAALGLQEEQKQNFIRNMAGLAAMDIGQNQWAQEFGAGRQDAAFNREHLTSQLNSQNNLEWLSRLINAGGIASQTALGGAELDEQVAMNRANLMVALSNLTGRLGDMSGAMGTTPAGIIQQFAGAQTLAGQEMDLANEQFAFQKLLETAAQTGYFDGQMTMANRALGAEITGRDPFSGDPTAAIQMENLKAALQLSQLLPNVQSGIGSPLLGGLFAGIGDSLNSSEGQMITPAWQTKYDADNRLQGIMAQIAAEERISAANRAAQIKAAQIAAAKDSVDMTEALKLWNTGDYSGAMAKMIEQGVDPRKFTGGMGDASELPGSGEMPAVVRDIMNRHGVDDQAASIIHEFTKNNLSPTAMKRQLGAYGRGNKFAPESIDQVHNYVNRLTGEPRRFLGILPMPNKFSQR